MSIFYRCVRTESEALVFHMKPITNIHTFSSMSLVSLVLLDDQVDHCVDVIIETGGAYFRPSCNVKRDNGGGRWSKHIAQTQKETKKKKNSRPVRRILLSPPPPFGLVHHYILYDMYYYIKKKKVHFP